MAMTQRDIAGRNGTMSVALVIAMILIGWLLTYPAYQDLSTQKQNLVDATAVRDERQQALNDLSGLVNTYHSQQQELSAIDQAMPNAPQVPQLLADLDQISKQTQVTLETLRLTDIVDPATAVEASVPQANDQSEVFSPPKLVKMKIELSIIGSYTSFPLFLELVEKNSRLFDIQQVNSESAQGQGASGELPHFNMIMYSYYQK